MTSLQKAPAASPPSGDQRTANRGRKALRATTVSSTGLWRGVAGVALLVLIFEVVSRLGLVSPEFLPPFLQVLAESFLIFGDPEFLADLLSTALTWAFALVLSVAVAVPLGVVLGLSEVSYRASRTVIELVRPMPAVALIPLVMLVVGQGLEMKVIVGVYAAMWPILFNTIYGVHGVDPNAKEMARSFGLSRPAVTWRVVIPGAAPFVATGIRLSSSIVLIVVITVELIAGGADGLGSYIAENRAMGNQVTRVYAGTLVAGFLGLAINLLMGAFERRWFSWNATKG
jgi:NitT/TauT family transport system permease protein